MSEKMRVRFAPSPTGALHIGGIRTALYNYLLAKQQGGTFILRIEDTDQGRYVEGAEQYITSALEWCGIEVDESPKKGGEYGPYRQSERKDIYQKYVQQLVDNGRAYYAFDTAEDLAEQRKTAEANKQTFKYGIANREQLNNSLTLSEEEVKTRLLNNEAYTVRLKVPEGEQIVIEDQVRGTVTFDTAELDDKILMKADGMPTYHLANVVDDHLMKITHVIRGEEWLPSTAHHVLLYRAFDWEETMPQFAHLPLILKPNGKGKLSKRDGAKFGFPVFPLSWEGKSEEDSFQGFKEFGFLPEALVNFLAFLGWNPGTEQELFTLDELVEAFSVEQIGKSGARFDIDKGKWFNQQYIIHSHSKHLATQLRPLLEAKGYEASDEYLLKVIDLMKERAVVLPDILEQGYFFFEDIHTYDEKAVRKNWKVELRTGFEYFLGLLDAAAPFTAEHLENTIKEFIQDRELPMGKVLQIFRLAISGTLKGPSVFEMAELIGQEEVCKRVKHSYTEFDRITKGTD
jgi:glutamyl-tRNA synthetase